MEVKTLESLVPPLNLCKRIPVGRFADSVLVYLGGRNTELVVVPRSSLSVGQFELVKQRSWLMYPAPMLQEILEALHSAGSINPTCQFSWRSGRWLATDMDNLKADKRSPVVAALRLWFKTEGVK